ncbi:hypothetical protein DEI99_005215 [Curtobacterium sp. MCLR17_036]|uniref:hypothetical protein n=1 Tax=Curtobacterium sp. MCLR17_036 TaxID=2175620 RepID=UPI000DA89717|nr:hypothetical protein [Curtobacterium sp. MCLR17_036]WIE65939.1 hypothetical protein DEI99_005215 [Curtobacterium sp. MCLR17_036]
MNYRNEAQAVNEAIGKLGAITQQVGQHEEQWRARFGEVNQDTPEWQALTDMKILSAHLVEAVGQIGVTVRDILTDMDVQSGR